MSTPEPAGEIPAEPGPASTPATTASTHSPRAVTLRTWALALSAAIVAGIGSVVVLEGILAAYKPSFQASARPYPSAEDMARITRAHIESGSLAYAATGALLGLTLGLAGGISGRSIKAAAGAGLAGLVLGGLVEGGAALGSLWLIHKKFDPDAEDILQNLAGHEALWLAVGLVGGLAFGLGLGGRGRWWKCAIGGLIGAALATVAYEIIGALAFPTKGAHKPVAETPETRALCQILIPLGAAIGSVLMARDPEPKPKTTPNPGA